MVVWQRSPWRSKSFHIWTRKTSANGWICIFYVHIEVAHECDPYPKNSNRELAMCALYATLTMGHHLKKYSARCLKRKGFGNQQDRNSGRLHRHSEPRSTVGTHVNSVIFQLRARGEESPDPLVHVYRACEPSPDKWLDCEFLNMTCQWMSSLHWKPE